MYMCIEECKNMAQRILNTCYEHECFNSFIDELAELIYKEQGSENLGQYINRYLYMFKIRTGEIKGDYDNIYN